MMTSATADIHPALSRDRRQMMGITKPLKTVTFLIRLSPEERENLNRMAQERDISLAEAFREGARLYFEEWTEHHDQARDPVAT